MQKAQNRKRSQEKHAQRETDTREPRKTDKQFKKYRKIKWSSDDLT